MRKESIMEPRELNSDDRVSDGVVSRAPRLAWTIAAVVVTSYCASALISVISSGANEWMISLASVYLLALSVLHMSFFSRRLSWTRPLTVLALVVEGCLVYLPLPLYGGSWVGLPSLLASAMLLVLPRAARWLALFAIVLGIAITLHGMSYGTLDVAYAITGGLVACLSVYSVSRLAGLIAELHHTRAEAANAAVASEQARFEQQSHELLGASLSAILPKGELARRLIGRNPERVQRELA